MVSTPITTFIAGTVERVLAGENVSPAAAPWTVLVPGAEGEVVAAVQEALIAAGVEVAGGADGVYGNDTMAAVAEYQRRNDGLQVTGAVDIATARSLGVYEDPDAGRRVDRGTDDDRRRDDRARTGASRRGRRVRRTDRPRWRRPAPLAARRPRRWSSPSLQPWSARRRYVVARRAARRWARVHPATSPRRSVADMRRAGELPSAPSPADRIYDHEQEQATAVES